MIYSVQNETGKVYGKYPLPYCATYTSDEWVEKISLELKDENVIGVNGVKASPLVLNSKTGESVERVVIDIDPLCSLDDIVTVHAAVSRIGFAALLSVE
jgi:hypothetical protein